MVQRITVEVSRIVRAEILTILTKNNDYTKSIKQPNGNGNGGMSIGGIGAGIYRPIRLEQVGSVTSIALFFSRNGATKASVTVTPYEGAVLDMSMMAAATPSITESINTGLGFADFVDSVSIQYWEGTQKSIMVYVIHAPAKTPSLRHRRARATYPTMETDCLTNWILVALRFSTAH